MKLSKFNYAFAVCTFTAACTTLPVDIGDKATGGDTSTVVNAGGKSNDAGSSGGGSGGTPITDGGFTGVPEGGKGTGAPPQGGKGGGTAVPPQGGKGGGTAVPPQGGSGGTPIDVSGAGKNQGGTGGLDSCNFPAGPLNTMMFYPRRTVTWRFEAAGSGGEGGQGGAGSLDSTCSIASQFLTNDHCQGSALLHTNSSDLPEVVFGDGNKLVWDPSGATDWVSPPIITRAAGDIVWVDYLVREERPCGTFCGSYTTTKLMIRDSADGSVRFMARQGNLLDDLSDAEVEDVFGVSATRALRCSTGWTDFCLAVTRIEFEHSLLGQVVAPASFTTVAVPNGEFAVFWTASQETTQMAPNCTQPQDGAPIARDNGFAASRIAP